MFLIPKESLGVRVTKDKGRGLFAFREIKEGTVLGDYTGMVLKTVDALREDDRNFYLMYYSDNASIYPEDVNSPDLHTVNHSCAPNCWMYIYHGHTLFFALREIEKGEELTVHYLLAPDPHCKPCLHICVCGSENCQGTMHLSKENYQKWTEFKNAQMETRRAPIRYNQLLKPLQGYPSKVSDKCLTNLVKTLIRY